MPDGERCVLSSVESVCPVCLQRLSARHVACGDEVYLEKTCPLHGEFRTVVWRGSPAYQTWAAPKPPTRPTVCDTQRDKGCPYDCGLCPEHRQQSCCVLLEVTGRCDLNCPVCFAQSGGADADPALPVIEAWFEKLLARGGPFNIQLSGGEPTMRRDLPEIIALGRRRGFSFFQLNTNGLRLAAEPDYAGKLKLAGLSCVFLQFDGTRDAIFKTLRGKALLDAKARAVEHCAAQGLGVVLVPTLVPGINTDNVGEIIRWGLARSPIVRGVHFQPISYFGRYPRQPRDAVRFTLPELMRELELQTSGLLRAADFCPPGGENAYCSFHGNYVLLADGRLQALPGRKAGCCQPVVATGGAKQAQEFVARRWRLPEFQGAAAQAGGCCDGSPTVKVDSLDEFLERLERHSFCVSAMAFQDAWTLELDRLRECLIHVVSPAGTLVPFCAYNLTSQSGQALYRGQRAGAD